MDVSTAVTLIKRQFGDEYGVVINDDDIYGWIYSAENDIIRNSGVNEAFFATPVSTFPYELPLKTTAKRIYFTNTPYKALTHTTYSQLDAQGADFSLPTTALPTHWYTEFNSVFLWPWDSTGTTSMTIIYNSVPTLMTGLPSANTFTIPAVFHDDIITYCVSKAHNKNNNLNAEKQMRDLYDKNIGLRNHEGESADTIVYKGTDPWDWEY